MTNSISQANSQIIEFNVAGKPFFFAESTLKQPHLKDSVLSMRVNGKWSEKTPFLDLDPDCFKSWIAPYIRTAILPDPKKLDSFREKRSIVAAANSIGLFALALYVDELLKAKYLISIKLTGDLQEHRIYNNRVFESLTKISDIVDTISNEIVDHGWHNSKDVAKLFRERCKVRFENQYLSIENTLEFYEINHNSSLFIDW